MGDKILLVIVVVVVLNPSISKTVGSIVLKFCTQEGYDDLMCSELSKSVFYV